MENNSDVADNSIATSKPYSVSSLAKENPTESNAIQIPKIELPKGGGALKGID